MQWILKDINKKTGKKTLKAIFDWKKRADDHVGISLKPFKV